MTKSGLFQSIFICHFQLGPEGLFEQLHFTWGNESKKKSSPVFVSPERWQCSLAFSQNSCLFLGSHVFLWSSLWPWSCLNKVYMWLCVSEAALPLTMIHTHILINQYTLTNRMHSLCRQVQLRADSHISVQELIWQSESWSICQRKHLIITDEQCALTDTPHTRLNITVWSWTANIKPGWAGTELIRLANRQLVSVVSNMIHLNFSSAATLTVYMNTRTHASMWEIRWETDKPREKLKFHAGFPSVTR